MHTMDLNPREVHETRSENPGRYHEPDLSRLRDSAVLSPARGASLISLKIVRS